LSNGLILFLKAILEVSTILEHVNCPPTPKPPVIVKAPVLTVVLAVFELIEWVIAEPVNDRTPLATSVVNAPVDAVLFPIAVLLIPLVTDILENLPVPAVVAPMLILSIEPVVPDVIAIVPDPVVVMLTPAFDTGLILVVPLTVSVLATIGPPALSTII